ncbi:MAG: Na+/H+ antiporter [Candidatus Eremiobacteraeota bacterium]|nr:Na+/H+ antiporter [Candidatus Eremiobacteraeota bacterium]
MQESSLLLGLLAAIVAFAILAKRLAIPYPIAFVVGGAAIALFPTVPEVRLSPDWIFLIILPPLLYSGGWLTDWTTFRQNLRPIGLLAIGLVIATTVAVAVVAHAMSPALGWAAAFALGAIVSPPDAVAAGAVFERFPMPRRILAILDGEGLVNDATALVIYRFAIIAALSGTFSIATAGLAFVLVAASGIAIGLFYGFIYVVAVKALRRAQLLDDMLDNALSLLTPYAVYLATDSIHVGELGPSAVLATVTVGIFVSRQSHKIFDPDSRLVAYSVWSVLIFLLNGLAFLLIGLQLRTVVHDPAFAGRTIWLGVAVSVLVILVRLAWVYPATYLPRLLFRGIVEREGTPDWRYVFVLGWSGMRGIVSLAAALALPFAFPGRNEILFVTFCVIFTTLVLQGLSLIPLLKWLHIDDGDNLSRREIEVRIAALRAGIARLRELESGFESVEVWEVQGRLVGEYEYRIAHLQGHLDDGAENGGHPVAVALDHRMQTEALEAERAEVLRMRGTGEIPDDIYRRIEYDLDLANARLT